MTWEIAAMSERSNLLRALTTLSLMVFGLVAVPSVADAQEARIRGHFMGEYSETLGTTSDFLQDGYFVGGGFSITPRYT